jgi:hypothetical protein
MTAPGDQMMEGDIAITAAEFTSFLHC